MENAATVNHLNCRAKGGTAGYKVATLGAAGGIGQHLAMLMKMNPLVSVLHLYDVVNTPNVTSYISQMDTDVIMRWFLGQQQLDEALTRMELVIIPAIVPRKPGMTRDDEIESYDGFVISGSSRHAHGNDAWICRLLTLFQKLDSIKKKVLGICFDHQILSHAMRGKSGRAMGYRNPNRPLVTIIQGLLLSQRSSSSLHI